MPVTELAILRLLPSTSSAITLSPSLRRSLSTAKTLMERSSNQPFYYLRCLEDPAIIYIIGGWPSVTYHMSTWIPSRENQEMLLLLKDQVAVEAMFHVDIDRTVTPVPVPTPGGSGVIAIGRHFVSGSEKRDGFRVLFEKVRGGLDRFAGGPENVVGGWRIDGLDEGKEEFVLFTRWQSKERHQGFAGTSEFREYEEITQFVDGVDVKHARLLDVDDGEDTIQ